MTRKFCSENTSSLLFWCIAAMFGLCALPFTSLAEGRCPPGQYPIGGQGAGGCAPVPASGGDSQSPVPTGRWIKTWGAIATSAGGDAGVSKGKLSKNEAARESLERCSKWGATDCKVGLTYKNQCVAAVAADKGLGTKLNTGATIEAATERATEDCRRAGSGTCKLEYSGCSEPYFEKF